MDFNAKQMKEDALIKEGRYQFRVKDAREKRSSSGNDMLNLQLWLNVNGRRVLYFDSLILTPKMFWKVEHFCQATGMPEKIDQGRLMAQDCFEREGWIDIIQKIDKESGELVNQTKDYVKPESSDAVPVNDESGSFDDELPNFS